MRSLFFSMRSLRGRQGITPLEYMVLVALIGIGLIAFTS